MHSKTKTIIRITLLMIFGGITTAASAMTNAQGKMLCLQARNGSQAALADLTTAAQKGDRSAENWLGVYYGSEKEFAQALPWTRKAAQQGDPLAEYVMGGAYFYGDGVARNHQKAAYWYKLAVAQGFQGAQGMLEKAETQPTPTLAAVPPKTMPVQPVANTVQSPTAPSTTPIPTSNTRSPEAENHLGYAYYSGQGKIQNYQKAVYWFKKAAQGGNASAKNNLGVAYNHGQGVPKNHAKAFYWYRQAAIQGNPSGETNLGVAYYEGVGVKSNTPNALHWWKKAAAQGDHRAQSYLSVVQQNATTSP
ncbi:MAG: sel1 repeat family protein [Acidithiobacillus sp.]